MRYILTIFLALMCITTPAQTFADPASDFQLEQRKYIQRVEFLIRQNLVLKSVQVENPEATVVLRYGADGKFQTVQIEEGSGDPAFDMAVELALLKSAPNIPSPPIPPNTTGPFSFTARICTAC